MTHQLGIKSTWNKKKKRIELEKNFSLTTAVILKSGINH